MWEVLFFKYTAIILAVIGSLIGYSIYMVHDVVRLSDPITKIAGIGLFSILIPALAGSLCGKLIQNLHEFAHRDQLTSLWNGRYFHSELTKEMVRLKRTQSTSCMALIDIDDFKKINDTYGHLIGDEVLRNIASVFEKNTRANDVVVRLGGDEFVILFPDTNLECASLLTEKLREMIANHRECYQATISVGVLLVHANVEVTQLLKLVDETLYQAKKTKNLVVVDSYS
ncbi:GGDEF domain-containing protein [Pelosinus sp. sgz500959]|uniref:GGDEF domain-containing protein n=1 Tax=Pelosinus sp. sgz500959 TaxID=3242472 RepID=UPI00367033D6